MNKYAKMIALVILCCLTGGIARGQLLEKLKKKAEEKIEKEADKVLNGNSGDPGQETAPGNGEKNSFEGMPEAVFDFRPGSLTVFEDNFSLDEPGQMPRRWKTNGTGTVVTLSGEPGNWFQLFPGNSYKLDTLLEMPENFTVEFDLLTRADEAWDLKDPHFGFARHNSVNNYIYYTAGKDELVSYARLEHSYDNVRSGSKDTGAESDFDFPLYNYANAKMHVAIQVDGERMKVYLDKYKVLDTRMMKPESRKYFYITDDMDRKNNNSQIYIGNFKIAEAK